MVSEWYLTEWYSEWSNGILNGTYKKRFSFFVNGILNGIPFRIPLTKKLKNSSTSHTLYDAPVVSFGAHVIINNAHIY